MMLENTTPVMKSTLSRLTLRSNSWRATSGLNWSSLTMTSAGRLPSLPPLSFTASRKPSRMSMPSADDGPESVLTKPTLTLSAAKVTEQSSAASTKAMVLVTIPLSNWAPAFAGATSSRRRPGSNLFSSHPDLQHVIERRLAVEHVHALQPDLQGTGRIAHQGVAIAPAEVAHVVAP